MIEFLGTDHNQCEDGVVALVDAMRRNETAGRGGFTFTLLNGVKLVANAKTYEERPDYTLELQWSFGMALRHPKIIAALLHGKDGCPNLVPELETLVDQLMAEFETMDRHDPQALLRWLIRLMPATWHKDVLSRRQRQRIIAWLDACPEYHDWRSIHSASAPTDHERHGQHFVKEAVVALQHFCLNETWLAGVETWLSKNQ